MSYIKETAKILKEKYHGDVPDTLKDLIALPGVGPKMAYITLAVAWNKIEGIGVDTHVHRIANRIGWASGTKSPEKTRLELQELLPKSEWEDVNLVLVGFGQILCLPRNPKCGECPINDSCPSSAIKFKKE